MIRTSIPRLEKFNNTVKLTSPYKSIGYDSFLKVVGKRKHI